MAPLSNQTSIRSGSLYSAFPDAETNMILSTKGLCKSDASCSISVSCGSLPAVMDFAISFFNSSIEPIQICSPLSLDHIGSGVPQNLLLLKFQSTIFSNQLPNLPSPVLLGFQLMVRLS